MNIKYTEKKLQHFLLAYRKYLRPPYCFSTCHSHSWVFKNEHYSYHKMSVKPPHVNM